VLIGAKNSGFFKPALYAIAILSVTGYMCSLELGLLIMDPKYGLGRGIFGLRHGSNDQM